MALDTVRGPVTNVVDGDTFDMRVERTGKHNEYAYNTDERIRIEGINTPELGTSAGARSASRLMLKLTGREVRCHVHARDDYGRLVSDVEVL